MLELAGTQEISVFHLTLLTIDVPGFYFFGIVSCPLVVRVSSAILTSLPYCHILPHRKSNSVWRKGYLQIDYNFHWFGAYAALLVPNFIR